MMNNINRNNYISISNNNWRNYLSFDEICEE